MTPTIEFSIALITAVLAFLVSAFGLPALLARIRGIENHIASTDPKINFLWEIYAVEAIKAARDQGLSQANSPVQMLPLWDETIPVGLRKQLERCYAAHKEKSTEIIALEIATTHKEQLKKIAQANSIDIDALIGGVIDYVQFLQQQDNEDVDTGSDRLSVSQN